MLTEAQATRLDQVRSESAAGGTRITTRKLPGGLIRITEYVRGEGKSVVTMGLDGHYL
jgi:hypothetical protein